MQILRRLLRQLSEDLSCRYEVLVAVSAPESAGDLSGYAAAEADPPVRLMLLSGSRGARMKEAATEASGDILWFLHADAQLTEHADTAILNAVRSGALGGYFRFVFAEHRTAGKAFLEAMIALRCRLGGVPYGDQGLFFTRAAYTQAGGHAPIALFEEVTLIRRIRRLGSFVALSNSIVVDTRRWEEDGYITRTLANRLLACGNALGVAPERLSRWYRRKK